MNNYYELGSQNLQNRNNNNLDYYRLNMSKNSDVITLTTFSDQIHFLNNLMEGLVRSNESIESKKTLFSNAIAKLIFCWNLETDANRVLLFRLMVSFFKYIKYYLDPKWLTPLLNKIESKDAIINFSDDSRAEILNLAARLRSNIAKKPKKVNVIGNAVYWIEKAKKNVKSYQDSEKWIKSYFEKTLISKELISLVDPFSLCRIEFPVRGKHCAHLQVFDLATFVNRWYHFSAKADKEVDAAWMCPICAIQTHPRLLYVDSFLIRLIKNNVDKKEIMLDSSGSILDEKSAANSNCIELLSDEESEVQPRKAPPENRHAQIRQDPSGFSTTRGYERELEWEDRDFDTPSNNFTIGVSPVASEINKGADSFSPTDYDRSKAQEALMRYRGQSAQTREYDTRQDGDGFGRTQSHKEMAVHRRQDVENSFLSPGGFVSAGSVFRERRLGRAESRDFEERTGDQKIVRLSSMLRNNGRNDQGNCNTEEPYDWKKEDERKTRDGINRGEDGRFNRDKRKVAENTNRRSPLRAEEDEVEVICISESDQDSRNSAEDKDDDPTSLKNTHTMTSGREGKKTLKRKKRQVNMPA